jgi:hypothetical protein
MVLCRLLLLSAVFGVAAACSGGDEIPLQAGAPAAEPAALAQHCFRNAYPFPDEPERQDVEELLVLVAGDQASGQLNWLPWAKDQRLGRFDGTIVDGVIEASYEFEQEGRNHRVEIAILLEDRQAIVSGLPEELGPESSIARVSC